MMFTLSLVAIIYFMSVTNFGRTAEIRKRLTITVRENLHDESIFNDVLSKYLH